MVSKYSGLIVCQYARFHSDGFTGSEYIPSRTNDQSPSSSWVIGNAFTTAAERTPGIDSSRATSRW